MPTKKVGSTGRFGPRYGRKIKHRVRDIEAISKATHICPKCKAENVKRESAGIWLCSRCGAKFAGGAFNPAQKPEKKQVQVVSVDEYEEEKLDVGGQKLEVSKPQTSDVKHQTYLI